MICDHADNCIFYRTHRYRLNEKQARLLIDSYCEGPLQSTCRLIRYREEQGSVPPDDLCPNGYRMGTHSKIF